MRKVLFRGLLTLCMVSIFNFPVAAQIDISTTSKPVSTEKQLEDLFTSLSSLQSTLRKEKRKRPVERKIKLITKKIITAVNSIPPEKCLSTLTKAMDDFYKLVSDLGLGIACGPPIIPPFLPGGNIDSDTVPITKDCIMPPLDEPSGRLQIGGPFGGAFADVNPVYDQARDLFEFDADGNDISDVCEGDINKSQ